MSKLNGEVQKSIEARLSPLHVDLWFAWSIVALLASFMVGYFSSQHLPWTIVNLVFTVASAFALIFSALLISHLISLKGKLNESRVFVLNETGLQDKISLLKLGFVPLKDMRRLGRSQFFGIDFLYIEIASGSCVFQSAGPLKKLLFQVYLLVFPVKFWLPLSWIHGSENKLLECWASLRYLKPSKNSKNSKNSKVGVLQDSAPLARPSLLSVVDMPLEQLSAEPLRLTSPPPPPPPPPVQEAVREESVLTKISHMVALVGKKVRGKISDPPNTSYPSELAKGVDPYQPSERSLVFQKIETIRKYVSDSGLDRFLCELYLEQLVWLPNQAEGADSRLEATWLSKDLDYEELRFKWKDRDFHFAIRKDLNEGEMGRLQVGYQGQVVFALKVGVEIGCLEPLEVEKFIEGAWEEELRELGAHFRALSLPSLNAEAQSEAKPGVEGGEAGGSENSEKNSESDSEQTSLTGLKRRFGL